MARDKINMNKNHNESLFSKDEGSLFSRGYQKLEAKVTDEKFDEGLELYKLKERMSSIENKQENYIKRISRLISDSFGISSNLQISGAASALVSIGIIFGMQITTPFQGGQLNQARYDLSKNGGNFQPFNMVINGEELLSKIDYSTIVRSDDPKKMFFNAIELAINSELTTMVGKKQGKFSIIVSNFTAGDISQERFKSLFKIPKDQNGMILIEFIETQSK